MTERPQRSRRDRPPFASSAGGRAFRIGLCLASLIGLAYATVVVLGLLGGGDQESLGLPTRHSGEGGQVTAVAPPAVEPENEAFGSASPGVGASPTPLVTPSRPAVTPSAAAPEPSEPTGAEEAPEEPPPAEVAEEPVAEAPTADEPEPTPSTEPEEDRGKLIDVNLLGIRISI